MTTSTEMATNRQSPLRNYSPAELARMPVAERNTVLLTMVYSGYFDFIDFGTHKGGGLQFGVEKLGGRCGLGVELSDQKAVSNLENGLYVYSGDLMSIPLTGSPFKFGICRHILEHLPDECTVTYALRSLIQLCSDFIYIEQPDFSNEQYLNNLGLVTAAATLQYHTCLLTEGELRSIVEKVGIRRYLVGGLGPLEDSRNPWVHAVGSPPNRMRWTENDLPKPTIEFDRPMYRDIVLLMALNDDVDLPYIAQCIRGLTVRSTVG
jgi:hypothetical protein